MKFKYIVSYAFLLSPMHFVFMLHLAIYVACDAHYFFKSWGKVDEAVLKAAVE